MLKENIELQNLEKRFLTIDSSTPEGKIYTLSIFQSRVKHYVEDIKENWTMAYKIVNSPGQCNFRKAVDMSRFMICNVSLDTSNRRLLRMKEYH